LLVCFNSLALGQSIAKHQLFADFGALGASQKNTPFWLKSNTWGTIPYQSNIAYMAFGLKKNYDSVYSIGSRRVNKFDYTYGIQVFSHLGNNSKVKFPEAFVKLRIFKLELAAGRWFESFGLGSENSLSSGGFIWSNNALPLPKIQLGFPNYVSILGKGLISVKGNMAHGWYGTQNWTKDYYIHQKMLYGKLGKTAWKWSVEAGVNNQAQWGGYSDTLKNVAYSTVNGYMPSDFNAFLGTAFPFPAIRRKFPPQLLLYYDQANYGGNVLGSVDFALNLKVLKSTIKIYRQIPYELGTLFTSATNADDGIYGLSIDLPHKESGLRKIVIESLHTYNQGYYRSGLARLLKLKDQHLGEIQGYLNHGQYLDGWSYNNRNIGTPFNLNDAENPSINKINLTNSSWNQQRGYYLAFDGGFPKNNFILKLSLMNYRPTGFHNGSVGEISQISTMLDYSRIIQKNKLIYAKAAWDKEGIQSPNIGLQAGIRVNMD
jgi:hypothetical protein